MHGPHTTLSRIKAQRPCKSGLDALLIVIGEDYPEDKPIYFLDMLDKVPTVDIIWAFRAAPEYRAIWVKFAGECAKQAKWYAADAAAAAADAAANAARAAADAASAADAAARAAAHAASYAKARDEQKEMLRKLLTEN